MSAKPWAMLLVDDDEGIHSVTMLAMRRAKFFGLPVDVKGAYSAKEAEGVMLSCDPDRLAVALVDVVMEHSTAGLELVGKLRSHFGSPLQIVLRTGQPGVMGPEEVTSKYDISNYLSKQEATPERLRTAVGLGIRHFRAQSAMRVLCESLATFTALFETATTTTALDQILSKALAEYSAVWQFDYLFLPDMRDGAGTQADLEPWQAMTLKRIQSMGMISRRSVSFSKLDTEGAIESWGCSIRPLSGRFAAAFAFRQLEAPSEILLRELQTLLRAWALARESTQLKQIAIDEQTVRAEMHRERRDAIAQMVAGVAHEVNTPLGVANAAAANLGEIFNQEKFTKLAEDEVFKEEFEDASLSIELIQRNIARADELIRSFRKLSVRQLVDEREDVDFAAAVADVVKLYSPKAKRSGMEVRVDSELDPKLTTWLGYPGHLSQILLNLITNAERYAYDSNGGVVDIIATSRFENDVPRFAVTVRDYGAGIPKENRAHIFDAFYTTGRNKGGTGLGLSIVHNVVTTVFGGTIHCESTVGQGTSFMLSFSHCKKQENDDPAEGKNLPDKVQIFQKFVELQQKHVREGTLNAEEQLELAEAKGKVDGFLSGQLKAGDNLSCIPCNAPAILVGASPVEVMVREIGEHGAVLVLANDEAAGARLTVRYSADPDLVINGEVAFTTELLSDSHGAPEWQIAVRFDELDPTQQRNLKVLLAQLMLEYWS